MHKGFFWSKIRCEPSWPQYIETEFFNPIFWAKWSNFTYIYPLSKLAWQHENGPDKKDVSPVWKSGIFHCQVSSLEGNLILCLKWVVQPTTTLRIVRDLKSLLIPKPGEKQGQTVFFWGGGSQLILREDMLQKMIVHIGKHGETLFKKHTVELNEGDQVAVLPLESQLTASLNTLVHTPVGREGNVELHPVCCTCGAYHIKVVATAPIVAQDMLVPTNFGQPKLMVQFNTDLVVRHDYRLHHCTSHVQGWPTRKGRHHGGWHRLWDRARPVLRVGGRQWGVAPGGLWIPPRGRGWGTRGRPGQWHCCAWGSGGLTPHWLISSQLRIAVLEQMVDTLIEQQQRARSLGDVLGSIASAMNIPKDEPFLKMTKHDN